MKAFTNGSEQLSRAVSKLKNAICQAIASKLSRRLIYFVVIRATAIMSVDPRHHKEEVPYITAMDVAKYFEQK